MNPHYKNRYDKFINYIKNKEPRSTVYTENHHIIPRCMKGKDDESNMIRLTLREHFLAHWLLWKSYPTYLPLVSAFLQMNNKNPNTEKPFQGRLTSRTYEKLKTQCYEQLGELMKDKVYLKNEKGETIVMSKNDYAAQDKYKFHTSGKVSVIDKLSGERVYIESEIYQNNKDQYTSTTATNAKNAKYKFQDSVTGELISATKNDVRLLNKEYGFKRLKHIQKSNVTCVDDYGNLYSIPVDQYRNSITTHKSNNTGKIAVTDLNTDEKKQVTREEYLKNQSQYVTSTKGKVLAKNKKGENVLVTKEEFTMNGFVGQTSGLCSVFNKETHAYEQITQAEFVKNRHLYSGPTTGKVNAINKQTGIRQQIPKEEFDTNLFAGLGNKSLLFLCQNKLTSKEKNVNIYEWKLVKDTYDIIDIEKFNKVKHLLP